MDALAEFRQEMILVPLTRMFQGQTRSDAEDSDLRNLLYNISSMRSPRAPHKLRSPGAVAPDPLQRWGSAAGHLPVPSHGSQCCTEETGGDTDCVWGGSS